jgi:hypothetical protein
MFDDADPDPGSGFAPETEAPGSLLSAIRRRQLEDQQFAALSAQERRVSCRYPVDDALALLSWWEPMQSRVCGARLVDISQTGVLVLSEAVPPADERVWLRLETPQVTDWVEVVPKGSTPEGPGAHRVRFAFREACPYDIFKAVVYKKPGS